MYLKHENENPLKAKIGIPYPTSEEEIYSALSTATYNIIKFSCLFALRWASSLYSDDTFLLASLD